MKSPHFSFLAAPVVACLLSFSPQAPAADSVSGYLVDDMFAHLGPNWQDLSLLKLSDWEVDSRAGTVTCSYWNYTEFADSSTSLGFELRKRFLPQTTGSVFVEFGFSGNSKADGRVWVVGGGADLDAIKFKTSAGSFGYEASDGTFVPLFNYSAGQVVNVRAIVYPSAKRFDVYINGKRDSTKGAWIPFRNSTPDINSFYIATSTTGTDALRMHYLTVTRGYILYERFLNSQMPDFWSVTSAGGTAGPTEWKTSNSKDIYSLKLEDVSLSQQATLGRTFSASSNKLFWEYKFLIPKKADGMTMLLRNGTSAAASIRTSGGNIVSDLPGGAQPSVLWTNYKENVWYVVRVIADPVSKTSDLYINGKKLATGAPFVSPVTAIDNVAFGTSVSGTGTLWLDDIYVGSVAPVSSGDIPTVDPATGTSHLLGMQTFFAGWRNGHHGGWDWIYRFPDRDSHLGFYDEGNPLAMEWQLKWMKEAGVDFILDVWLKPFGDGPIKEPLHQYTEGGLHEGYFYAQNSQNIKFAIADFSHGNMTSDTFRKVVVPYWIEYYFRDQRYLRLNNKPVIAFGCVGEWFDLLGVSGVRNEIDYLKSELANQGYSGAVCLAVYDGYDPNALNALKLAGFDAFYAYNRNTTNTDDLKSTLISSRTNGAATSIVALPVAPHGRNGEGWDMLNHGYLPATQFESLLNWIKNDFFVPSSTTLQGEKIALLTNWNEYGEGYFLCPTRLTNFNYLDATRRVFTSSSQVTNSKPTATQREKWNVLYSKSWLGRVWAFDSLYPDLEGWTSSTHITNLKQEKGFLSGEVVNSDPALFSRGGYAIDAANSKITIRMKNSSGAVAARIYFETPVSGFSQSNSKPIAITPNSDFKQYSVDMAGVPGWSGTISRIRLDPFDDGSNSGTFSIDYIKLSKP
jgi:hypothetical protein